MPTPPGHARRGSLVATVWLVALAGSAAAAPSVRAIVVALPDAAPDDPLRASALSACRRAGLADPEIAPLAGAPAPQAASALATAIAALDQLKTDEALRALDVAANDAAVTGGAGLGATALDDIYLLRAMALQRSARPDRQRAWEDLVRAATLAPERLLDDGRFPPAVVKDWKRAVAEVQRRPRGTLVVRAPLEARISIDARAPGRSPAVAAGLPYGEHLVRVEEPGRLPWGTVVSLAGPTVELEVPPRAALALDDRAAAARARAAGAAFALVIQPRAGAGGALLEVALIDVAAELRRDSQLVDATPGALDAAVRRLVEEAAPRPAPRPIVVQGASPPRPWLARPSTWIAAGAVVVAGVVTAWALSHRTSTETGFSSSIDTSRIGQ